MARKKQNLTKADYEFMHSLSGAVLQIRPRKLHLVLMFWFVSVIGLITWAGFAHIDEIARGNGEVVPSGENQIVQNLEGGIIEEILVKEGQFVKKGEVLIKIKNQKSKSSLASNNEKLKALKVKAKRLQAQSLGKEFNLDETSEFLKNEKSLFNTNIKQLKSKVKIFENQLTQIRKNIQEAQSQKLSSKSSLKMINEEIQTIEPMVKKGFSSKLDLLSLKREKNSISQRYKSAKISIPRFESQIAEVKNKIKEASYVFKSKSKEELSEVLTTIQTLSANSVSLDDQVSRTLVRAPMHGIVQKLFIHTVSGVVSPAQDLVEMVPLDSKLIVEVKIKPSDIAFIYIGQKAKVKFSAFDFSIYGGLEGEVIHISADTIKDKEKNQYYIVRIKTDKNSFKRGAKEIKILPGMTVSVDILTGKKTVLDYILKPILKTKQYTFSER